MKTAKVETVAFWADCAYCGQPLENKTGSLLFSMGIHAAWVFVMKADGIIIDVPTHYNGVWFDIFIRRGEDEVGGGKRGNDSFRGDGKNKGSIRNIGRKILHTPPFIWLFSHMILVVAVKE